MHTEKLNTRIKEVCKYLDANQIFNLGFKFYNELNHHFLVVFS